MIMESPVAGGLGGTYGGNPLACAAALAVLDVMEPRSTLRSAAAAIGAHIDGASARGRTLTPALATSAASAPWSRLEFVQDRTTKTPDNARVSRIVAAALSRGLVLLSAGTYGNVIRVLVPLTAPDAVVDEGLDVMAEALQRLAAGRTELTAAAAPEARASARGGVPSRLQELRRHQGGRLHQFRH